MSTAPAQRPILFSAPMVRALLDGRKMQTRRTRALEFFSSPENEPDRWKCVRVRDGIANFVFGGCPHERHAVCPYGKVGDTLWVRETCCTDVRRAPDLPQVIYAADYRGADLPKIKWRPSIHMPRWAARITLRITDVRVERLQDISYEDAIAEGCSLPEMRFEPVGDGETWEQTARRLNWPQRSYRQLWESINGAGSWDVNPWVWAVSFEVVR